MTTHAIYDMPEDLTTLPPRSHFQRPWSPHPFDPAPDSQNDVNFARDRRWLREPSDISVEAFDLADYAIVLRQNQYSPQYPPSPPPHRPFSINSRDSLRSPPSLYSGPTTISSSSHSPLSPHHRPYSLPDRSHTQVHSPPLSPTPNYYDIDQGIDVSQFPAWSRNWYPPSRPVPRSLDAFAPQEPHDPFPVKNMKKEPLSPFDPAYHAKMYHGANMDHAASSAASHTASSTRDLLPWAVGERDPPTPVDAETKEERMRLLEQEFGVTTGRTGSSDAGSDAEKAMIGSVDEHGKLITQGPKKRILVRALEFILSLTASVASIYTAIVRMVFSKGGEILPTFNLLCYEQIIKPNGLPPPRGTVASYVLYACSIILTLVLLFVFLVRPCIRSRRSETPSERGASSHGGMMVLPIQAGNEGKKNKSKDKKRGKGGHDPSRGGDVQVNLIIDPSMFDQYRQHDDDGTEEDGDEMMDEDRFTRLPRIPRRRRAPRRRGIFAGLALETQWKSARRERKKISFVDAALAVLWGGVFVFVLMGKRCPSGTFEGWCDGYNVATAAACLSSFLFCLSLFFDVKDLHASRVSPRTRP
jgi:hypothetical protein